MSDDDARASSPRIRFFGVDGNGITETGFFLFCAHRAGRDCVSRLLDKSERRRLGSKSGASEVKQHRWFAKINWGLLRNTRPPVGVLLVTQRQETDKGR